MPTLPKSRILLIAISNAADLTERLAPALRPLAIQPRTLVFPPYSTLDVAAIVTARLQWAWKQCNLEPEDQRIVEPSALQLLAKRVSARTGDVRSALTLARTAVLAATATWCRPADGAAPLKLNFDLDGVEVAAETPAPPRSPAPCRCIVASASGRLTSAWLATPAVVQAADAACSGTTPAEVTDGTPAPGPTTLTDAPHDERGEALASRAPPATPFAVDFNTMSAVLTSALSGRFNVSLKTLPTQAMVRRLVQSAPH